MATTRGDANFNCDVAQEIFDGIVQQLKKLDSSQPFRCKNFIEISSPSSKKYTVPTSEEAINASMIISTCLAIKR